MNTQMIPEDRFIRNDDGQPARCDLCIIRLAERVYSLRRFDLNLCLACFDERTARRAELEAV